MCFCIYIYIHIQSREEFEVDPELRVLLEKEAADKVEEARKELAWESEKKRIGLEKLTTAFIDDIAVEHVKYVYADVI